MWPLYIYMSLHIFKRKRIEINISCWIKNNQRQFSHTYMSFYLKSIDSFHPFDIWKYNLYGSREIDFLWLNNEREN